MKKTIYFLRHGQTKLNKAWVHQFPDTPLSELGTQQAKRISTQLAALPVDLILASPLERTRQTTAAVLASKKVPVEYNDLFVELRRPKSLWGTSWFNLRSLWIMGMSYLRAGSAEWHHSDEENLHEFHLRARAALEYVAARPEQNILVVTHRGFMANMVASMNHDGLDTVAQFRRALWKNLSIGNCCYVTATWEDDGARNDGLVGKWKVEKGVTCPK